MMTFDLEDAIAVLERTPAALRAWLDGLPQPWLDAREGEGTWNPVDVVGHLVLGERTDWIPRARQILEHGDAAAFEPFDRFGHLQRGRQSVAELLDEFAELRRQSIAQLRAWKLQETDWTRPGLHPDCSGGSVRTSGLGVTSSFARGHGGHLAVAFPRSHVPTAPIPEEAHGHPLHDARGHHDRTVR